MERKRLIDRRRFLRYVSFALLAAFLVTAAGVRMGDVAYTQEEPPIEHYLGLLSNFPDLDRLRAIMEHLDEDAQARQSFMDDPRGYLNEAGLELGEEFYQITALDFDVGFEAGVFGSAEPRGDLEVAPEGIGMFYEHVGLFIQEAMGVIPATEPPSERYLRLLSRISADTLNRIGPVLEELDDKPAGDGDRKNFRGNPRDFLLKKGIRLPSDFYRLVALDFELALAVEGAKAINVSPTRAGLAVINEGIGMFYGHVGIFIQEAL